VTLGRAARFMPSDAVYVGVVDPGVGSGRRAIAVESGAGALLVGPDNGLLSMAWEEMGGAERAFEIVDPAVLLHPVSKTFHGRDVFAPAAAHLANGLQIDRVGSRLALESLAVVELPGPMVAPGAIGARVVGIDGFGNVQLNAGPADLEAAGIGDVMMLERRRIPRVPAFADLPKGRLGAIIDSAGYLALVVNQGSAAEKLGLRSGATVTLARPRD
jgi:hypothetical protein